MYLVIRFCSRGGGETWSGELRHISKLRFWPLDAVLHDKYLFPQEEADAIASFLGPMLRLHPDKRAKASELMHHKWLDGVSTQGELDVIRRAEEEEAQKRKATSPAAVEDGRKKRLSALQLQRSAEADAMKPVDDLAGFSAEGSPMATAAPALPVPSTQQHHPPTLNAAPPPPHAAPAAADRGAGGQPRQPTKTPPRQNRPPSNAASGSNKRK
jgi:serine/threonine-protein kinase SRPK3